MSVDARVIATLGDFHLDAHLTCNPGETVALLGPNGAGKSTVVRAIAGLLPIDQGSVSIDGEVADDPAGGIFIPAERRRVGVVFQDYVLFPHLTVRENIAFGVRNFKINQSKVEDWIVRLDLADLADRKPRQLSGGQAQRVALARALAIDPRALLLDEPLAALDASTKLTVRSELRHFLSRFEHGTILVTHDPLDALVLADRVVVIESGCVTQEGLTAQVANEPRTDYLAALLGVTLIHGTSRNGVISCVGGGELVTSSGANGAVVAVIRPQAISLHRKEPEGSARNVWPTIVTNMDAHHDQVRVTLAGPPELVAAITPAAVVELGITPGVEVWAALKATDIAVHPV